MKIRNYMKPSNVEEAYELVNSGGVILGGGAWLKLMPKAIENAVDLGGLKLDEITETDENIYIGSMVTLRALETNRLILGFMDGFIGKAAGHIMGVQVRNVATVGGTVASRFGFSDLITALLAADATLDFHHHGRMSLADYLSAPFSDKDILVSVILKKDQGKGCYLNLKKTSTDFPVVNAAATMIGNHCKITVGARPGAAVMATKAMTIVNGADVMDDAVIDEAVAAMAAEITFGTNSRATEAYRLEVAKTLVARCLKEVIS